ncbi:hypothetical protein SLE2022_304610 [Rubroshorea leprosula]
MKWGRKKPSSSSSSFSSRPPLLSHVLPTSWLCRFKRMSVDAEPKPAKGNHNSLSSSKVAAGEGRFHAGDGDAFWRLSFGEKSVDGKESRGVLRSVWYDPDDEVGFPPSSCQRCRSNAMRTMETERVKRSWDVEKIKEYRRDTEMLPGTDNRKGETLTIIKTPRLISARDLKLRNRFEEAVEEKRLRLQRINSEARKKSTNPGIGREELTGESLRKHHNLPYMNLGNFNLTTNDEGSAFATRRMEQSNRLSPEYSSSEWRKLKEMKIEELKVKNEIQRKSLYMSRGLQRRKTKQSKDRVFSPRTPSKVEICKIKALEDMKKAKLKMKAAKQRRVKESTRLENFAVVKCSFDPEKDFRDSMIEMIMEKKISRPEELEELLACYLTLNSDEYHELIIKVFRQVWFDLDQAIFESFDTELHTEECFQD